MRRSRRPLRTSGAQRVPMARRIASRSGAALLYYLVPSFVHGWSSGGSATKTVTREAALVSNSRSGAASVPNTGVQRSGFGSTARESLD